MGRAKDRVVAIDYFRGICILLIILNHASVFTNPFDVISGASRLWTGAAEMFFLLSGLTFGIVRGGMIKNQFKKVLKKTYRRAAILYAAFIFSVAVSIGLLVLFKTYNLPANLPGSLPTGGWLHTIFETLILKYSPGWADFLMFYAVYLLAAPFILRGLWSKFWLAILALSAALFVIASYELIHFGAYRAFFDWQLYFVIGIILARFRLPALAWFHSLPRLTARRLAAAILAAAAVVLGISFATEFHVYKFVDQSLPGWLENLYRNWLDHKPAVDRLLMNDRFGVLRPAAALLTLAGGYVVYQHYKKAILSHTGRLVNSMGRDTLVIFVAQAIIIPLMAAIPLERNLLNNFLMTNVLLIIMVAINQRKKLAAMAAQHIRKLTATNAS
jgi:hypothetical protein